MGYFLQSCEPAASRGGICAVMTPAARLQAAIEILEGLRESRMPADRFIRDYFRARRYAGSKDRAAVSARVYDIFRHRASYAWRMQSETPRALAIASVLAEQGAVDSLFTGGPYAPAPLSDAERAVILAPARELPSHVTGEYPEFLESELRRAFGSRLPDEMAALQQRAPIDLRVNTLKAHRDDVLAALKAEGFDAQAGRHAPTAIRVSSGARGLERTRLFLDGAFEFQDEAAQTACILSGASSGMRVLDLAAGAGGKSLALAALMRNVGEIVAQDIDAGRLAQIGARAARAGVTIIRSSCPVYGGGAAHGATEGAFDLVFVDAPCSGSGTWRRQPENKWRLTPERLAELKAAQDLLLDEAAARVKPGGRLVYATCSILPCENEDRIRFFLERHPGFQIRAAADAWAQAQASPAPPGVAEFFVATPFSTGTDGFFTAAFSRVR